MTQNLLKLNDTKTNIIYFASPHCVKTLKTSALQIGASSITPNGSVKNQGLHLVSMLYGISDYNINRLQRIQNSAAHIVTNTRKYDHITPFLQKLHWLHVRQRIHFKILLKTYKSINDMGPEYLCELVSKTPVSSLRILITSLPNYAACSMYAIIVTSASSWVNAPLSRLSIVTLGQRLNKDISRESYRLLCLFLKIASRLDSGLLVVML